MDFMTASDNPRDLQRRVGYIAIGIVIIFLFLFLRAWSLQILKGSYYKEQSKNNRVRVAYIQSPRGLIFDRHGELLVNNVPSFNLYVVLEDVPDRQALIDRLENLIEIDRADLERRINTRNKRQAYVPVKIKEGLSLKEVTLIESHRVDLAGIKMEAEPQRNYPHGTLAAHLLGYVGEISPAQLQRPENADIFPGTPVGQSGVEKSYETHIRGQVGEKEIEVDAMGHEMKTLRTVLPIRGNDVYITIDLRIQQVAEEALGANPGSIVAVDPRNGEILAMVSHPAFDPNQLSRSLSPDDWQALSQNPDHPLTNRSTQGQYPPASTFKLVMAAAALETKEVTVDDEITCFGGFRFGRRVYKDWKIGGHGPMNLHDALVQSCDVYFYTVGRQIGIERLADYAFRFGLGQPTGIELASEKGGLIPTPQWKARVKGEPWFPGETISASIGQGFITVTPLQMAHLAAAVSQSGLRYRPYLIKAIRERSTGRLFEFPPVEIRPVDLQEETFTVIREALEGVVTERHGTGRAARSRQVPIAGKTGTAQVVGSKPGVKTSDLPRKLQDHAWFIAYAPVDLPRIAVAVLVENGGHGGEAAAPLARRVIEEFIKNDPAEAYQQL